MSIFENLKISGKILVAFIFIIVLSVGISVYIGFSEGRHSLEKEAFNKLTVVREMKAEQIERYFQDVGSQIITFSEDRMIVEAMRAFDEYTHLISEEFDVSEAKLAELQSYYQDDYLRRLTPNLEQEVALATYWPEDTISQILQYLYLASNPRDVDSKYLFDNADDGSRYSQVHKTYHPIIRNYLEEFDYYDIFLVDVNSGGRVVYSVFKEVDFGTSLLTGPYADTNFGEVYRLALESDNPNAVYLVDFEPYHPSYNALAAFISSPIYDDEEMIGVLIFQVSIDRINDIMTHNQRWSDVGLGESGESYVVGEDYLLRSESRFLMEDRQSYLEMIAGSGVSSQTINQIQNLNTAIGLQRVQTEGVEAALHGESGTEIFTDYRGVSVLSSYRPLDIDGVNWVIMSEIDEAEAFAFIYDFRDNILLGASVLIIIIIIVSLLLAQSITRPLRQLTQYAGRLAAGNLDESIIVSGNDEIRELADSFDTMRQNLKRLINDLKQANDSLEQRVIERTEQLSQEKDRINVIMNAVADAIVTMDSNQNISFFNPRAEEIFGYAAEEVLGKPVTMLMPEVSRTSHPQKVREFHKQAVTTRSMNSEENEIRGQRKDGAIFPAESDIAKTVIGGDVFYTAFFRDITKRKLAEEQRLELTMDKERAGILEQFIKGASHDLRTPLGIITSSLYILQTTDDAEKRVHFLSLLQEQTTRLGNLLEEMLDMVRLDDIGQFAYQYFDLNSVVTQVVLGHDYLAKQKGHTVNQQLATDELPVYVDLFYLSRTITNVVLNAFYYTSDGGNITIKTFRKEQEAILIIEDNGIGISEKHIDRIFERFYRVDEARGLEKGGSGLGLAFVKKIVEMHKGRIEVESTLGQGSIFTITLPLAERG